MRLSLCEIAIVLILTTDRSDRYPDSAPGPGCERRGR